MRFLEIASPEDQLALWKLVSDKIWSALAQQLLQFTAVPVQPASREHGRVVTPHKSVPTHLPNAKVKTEKKSTGKPKRRAAKATRAPMAPAPKPLPKPRPLPITPSQATNQQAQQHQQIGPASASSYQPVERPAKNLPPATNPHPKSRDSHRAHDQWL